MKFPYKKYSIIEDFTIDYNQSYADAFNKMNLKSLKEIIKIIEKNYLNKNNKIIVCGNGGSASLANHFACDHQKILSEIKKLRPVVISLCSNTPLITAISNDISYVSVFSEQINQIGNRGDILITISSSGNSQNIVNAIKSAKIKKIKTISLTGFDGGRSKKIANFNLHFETKNYGIIETLHHTVINLVSQFIRNKYLTEDKIKKTKF